MIFEVLITFRSGAEVTVHMSEKVFEDFGKGLTPSLFVPAPDYHKVFLNRTSVDAAVIVGTVDGEEETADGDESEATTPAN